jgi:LytS/YehU family sensor histidine kinase
VLEVTEHPTISLKEELAFVEDYLGIERSRMGNRLQVSTAIDEETLDCQVPVLGLQVLVENAIKHGLEPRVEGGEIHISTQLEKGRLRIAVQDPGNGQSRSSNGSGKALANLRARLNRPSDLVLSTIPQGFEAAFTFPQVRG